MDAFCSKFAGVKGHAHSITAKRRDHSCSITDHQHMIFYLRLLIKTDLRDRNREFVYFFCPDEYVFKKRILGKYRVFHFADAAITLLKIAGSSKIAEVVFIIFDLYNAAVSIFKIVKCYVAWRMIKPHMIFYADVIVQFTFARADKRPFPFNIEVASLAKTATGDSCIINLLIGLY